jgi:hypothetical protein
MRFHGPIYVKFLGLLTVLVCLCAGSMAEYTGQEPPPKLSPAELISRVVQNELKAADNNGEFCTWKQRTVKPNRTTVRQMVETPDGMLARILSLNGKPLTPDQQQKEDARINRLLDPKQMQQKRKEQKEDEARTRKLVAALPDAFLYKQIGTEEKNGHTLVTLHFTPNPDFNPPSRETLVYEGMEGTIEVDSTAMRLLKIDGTMFRDISIGWGIIGHLDKGGRFEVQQNEVAKGIWEITYMRLNFTGKALIFKNIRIDETDTSTDFHKVPKMTVAEAINFLKKADNENGTVAGESK